MSMRPRSMSVLAGAPLLGAAVAMASSGCIGVPAKKPTNAAPKGCSRDTLHAPQGVIDDFEDGNTQVAQIGGRGGYWFKSADASGSFFGPDPIGPVLKDGSLAVYAVGKTATGADAWGALLGAMIGSGQAYDASAYVGVSFRARCSGKSARKIRFEVSDVNTHPDGDVCKNCWNHFGTEITLTTEWKEHKVLFATLAQEPYWGDPRPSSLTTSKLFSVVWEIKPDSPFEFWVDDIHFLQCQ